MGCEIRVGIAFFFGADKDVSKGLHYLRGAGCGVWGN